MKSKELSVRIVQIRGPVSGGFPNVARPPCLSKRAQSVAASTPRNSTNVRLYLLAAMLVCGAAVICLRLVYLQIFRYGSFEQRAQHQQQRTIEVSASRGIIYDRAGHELAMSIAVDSAFAVPSGNSRSCRAPSR